MEVKTLNQKDFSIKCAELISKLDFKPDLIIGILNGGGYVMDEIKNQNQFKKVHFELVTLQRNQKFKSTSIFKNLLKLLPYSVLNKLRVYESEKAKKSIKEIDIHQISNFKIDLNFLSTIKKPDGTILIVDDAIDTGKTMCIVKNNLIKQFPKAQIKTAVVSWTIEASIIKPDYFVFKNSLVRFPWSKDYKGKDRF